MNSRTDLLNLITKTRAELIQAVAGGNLAEIIGVQGALMQLYQSLYEIDIELQAAQISRGA